MCPVLELAKYIVVKCIEDRHPISNLQLQKILYYIQREFLQKLGKVAFRGDIEAWPFGPVVPEVYYYFCGAGAMPITLCDDPTQNAINSFSEDELEMIDEIVKDKRKLNPWDMVNETHKKGAAWDSVYKGGQGNRKVISTDKIKTLG